MAKYSKEQRRCAVELYVRYECCAADMVRELGYPSREASRMWHRDWLEEQRTGEDQSAQNFGLPNENAEAAYFNLTHIRTWRG